MILLNGRMAAVLAPLVAIALASIPNLPAAADVQQTQAALNPPDSQTLTVASSTLAPTASRDDFTVTIVTVVQWPVPSSTPISSGFGLRNAPCRGCSSNHMGVDFTPGGGYPIEAIADGTVISAGWEGGLGECVRIQHAIDGVSTVSVYGHMIAGSLRVERGQHIDRGTVVGLTGSTGASTGNHLHFQVEVGGVPIDPLPWIKAHANSEEWQ